MSTLEATPPSHLRADLKSTLDVPFVKWLVIANGALPLGILAWDAWFDQLGANAVNHAIHITGILSLVFLFLSLLITPLRLVTGQANLVAYRRALGLYGFFYAAVHLVIYVVFDRSLDLTSTLEELSTRRYLQVGIAALMLMVPLAVTSANVMINKLGPKRWKLLHRTAYVATALGVLHYYMLVKSDVRQPLAFAAVLTPVLGYRFVHHYLSLRRTRNQRMRNVLPKPSLGSAPIGTDRSVSLESSKKPLT